MAAELGMGWGGAGWEAWPQQALRTPGSSTWDPWLLSSQDQVSPFEDHGPTDLTKM